MPVLSPAITGVALDTWTIVIGFLMPNLVAIIIQTHWPSRLKTAICALSCLVAAIIELALKGQLDPTNLTLSFLVILGSALTFFNNFWKPFGLADAIEKATNVSNSDTEGGGE